MSSDEESLPPITFVTNERRLHRLVRWLKRVERKYDGWECAVALDTETYAPGGKQRLKAETLILDRGRVMMMQLSRGDRAWCIPLSAYDAKFLDERVVFSALQPFFLSKKLTWVMHHANYDVNMLLNHGVRLRLNRIYCTMLAGLCWNENLPASLKERCILVNMRLRATRTVDFGNYTELAEYATRDAIATWKLYAGHENGRVVLHDNKKRNMLLKGKRRWFFEHVERPVFRQVVGMERRGVSYNQKRQHKIDAKILARMDKCAAKVYRENGAPFNIGSTKQLGEFLFSTIGLHPVGLTAKGAPSVNKFTLCELQDQHPAVKALMTYNKLRALRRFTSPETGIHLFCDAASRIHPTISQYGARTNRFSMSRPNGQQIPSKTDIFGIRKCFRAKKGHLLIVGDKDQIELRLMAIHSGDPAMLEAYKTGKSIHLLTGAKVGLLPKRAMADDLTKEEKSAFKETRGYHISKNVNFGAMYEGGAYTILPLLKLEGVKIEQEELEEILRQFWKIYQRVPLYRTWLYDQTRAKGYFVDICGRPYTVPNIASPHKFLRRRAERQVINTTIQGGAATCFKFTMLACGADAQLRDLECRMLLQVHDELVFEVPEKNGEAALKRVKEVMDLPPPVLTQPLRVPLTTSVGIGPTWAEAKG